MHVVTLGPPGTYSAHAAEAVADEVSFLDSVTKIFEKIADKKYRYGVAPVENSIEGSVSECLDCLEKYDLSIVEEIVMPINHSLISSSEDFSIVASHSQALGQCQSFLEREYPNTTLETVGSTTRAVEKAKKNPDVAAIAHPDNIGGNLHKVAEDIQDRAENKTRFFRIASKQDFSDTGTRTSVIVHPNTDYSGLLLEILEAFADRDINLRRIESQPSGIRLGDYLFHIDFDSELGEPRTQAALNDIEQITDDSQVQRLGSYDITTLNS